MWYYTLNGQQAGPISQAELQQKLQGELTPDTLVWKKGMGEWVKAGEVVELQPATPAMSAVSSTEADNPYAAPATAGVTAPSATGINEIPDQPVTLDIGFCIKQGWKFTINNFGNVFLLWFVYLAIVMTVGAVVAGIGLTIDGPQPAPVTSFEGMSSSEAFLTAMEQADQKGPVQSILDIPSQIFQTYLGMGLFAFSLALVRGQETSISMLFSQSGGKLLKVIGASILYGLMVGIGCLFLIVPGIYLAIRFMYYHSAIVDKDLGVIESLKYSSQLTRNNKLSIFGLGLLLIAICVVGAICLFVGLIWAIPTAWLATSISYCYLHGGERAIVVQN